MPQRKSGQRRPSGKGNRSAAQKSRSKALIPQPAKARKPVRHTPALRSTRRGWEAHKFTSRQLATSERAFAFQRLVREGKSVRDARREAGIDSRTAYRYLQVANSEHLRSRKSDRLSARMLFPTATGDEFVIVRGSKARSHVGHFYADRGKLLRILADGNVSPGDKQLALDAFRDSWQGKHIGGRLVQFDLDELARAGVLSVAVEGIYQTGKRGRK